MMHTPSQPFDLGLPARALRNAGRPTFLRKLLFAVTTSYTILLITRPHEFIPSLATSPMLQVLVVFGFGVWLLTSDKGTELPQFRILPFFLMFVWLSLGFAGWWGGIVPALDKLLPPILLFVIVSGSVRTPGELKTYSLVVVACACVLVLHGHLQRTTGIGWTGQPMIFGRITYSGIFNDPNDMGLLIVVSIAMTIFHLRTRRRKIARWVMWAALAWLLYGVYLTDSRGTMLAAMVVLGLETWRSYGKSAVIAAGLVAVPILVAFTRLAELNAEEDSAENRVDAWYEGVQMLIDHPIFGVGWGMFSDYNPLTAHNSLVLAMAELGLTGYTLWLGFVLLTGWMALRLVFPNALRRVAAEHVTRPAVASSYAGASVTAQSRRDLWTEPSQRSVAYSTPERGVAPRGAANSSGPIAASAGPGAADEAAERLAARSLLFAAAGFAVGAFFLSQSYKAMLFLTCGLIVGRYLGMREAGLPVPRVGANVALLFGAALASVVGMWILVRILL